MLGASATMVMLYKERFDAQEMTGVLTSMRNAWALHVEPGAVAAHDSLCRCGAQIETKFRMDNLPLTAREGANGSEKLALTLQSIEGCMVRGCQPSSLEALLVWG